LLLRAAAAASRANFSPRRCNDCIIRVGAAPIVGWSASHGDVARASTPLAPDVDTLAGLGTVEELNSLHIVASGDSRRGRPNFAHWLRSSSGPDALALGHPTGAAHENPVLQAGNGKTPQTGLDSSQLTVFIEFKLIGR
jgi:hypothetical protein